MLLARALLPRATPYAVFLGRRLASTRPSARTASGRRRPSAPARSQPSPSTTTTTTTTTTKPKPKPNPDAATTTATKKQFIRRVVLTGAVALITIVGAVTGARLKDDRDQARLHKEVQELPLDERIAILEDRRSGLVGMRMPIERKLVGLRERMAAEAEAERKKENGVEGSV